MAASQPELLLRRELGNTGLMVTPLCIGTAVLGSMPQVFGYAVDEERALATMRMVLEGPINFIDTGANYSDGESERRIGLAMRERGGLPDDFVLATKADPDAKTGDFSTAQVRRSIERSLRLLQVERLQLVYLHEVESVPFEYTMSSGGPAEGLLRAKEEGLVQHVGVSGGPIELMSKLVKTGAFEVVLSHNRYTLLNTAASPLLDLAATHRMAAVNAAPFGGGILIKGPDLVSKYAYAAASPELLERVHAIDSLCKRHGVPLAAVALQFSLREPRIATTVVGISRPERVAQTVELAQVLVPDALWEELRDIGIQHDDLG
jgi:D-threo-aldose 1-dehydrogenase